MSAYAPRLLRSWLAPLLLALLLAGCTGTSSPQPPRLLFVTHSASPSGPFHAGLVQDDLAGGGAGSRFTYLPDTQTVLPGEPVAMDVVDRAGSRSEAVLLLETGANAYSAAWFPLQDIDPELAGELAPRLLLELAPLLAGSLADPQDLCLQDMQTTFAGDVIALLNVPGECGGSLEPPSIFVVDSGDGSVQELATSIDLLPSSLFIQQGTAFEPDELYFLDGATGHARLAGVTLPSLQAIAERAFASGSDQPVPLQLTYSAGAFIALQPGTLNLLAESPTSHDLQAATASGVIADPYGSDLQALLVLHSSGSNLHVHRTPADADPVTLSLSGSRGHGTVDPAQMWVYVTRPGGLWVVDLFEVLEETGGSTSAQRFTVTGLGQPGFITWVEGVLPAP